jgi:DNA invertase Pin-like site-specific DNA recombinase
MKQKKYELGELTETLKKIKGEQQELAKSLFREGEPPQIVMAKTGISGTELKSIHAEVIAESTSIAEEQQ